MRLSHGQQTYRTCIIFRVDSDAYHSLCPLNTQHKLLLLHDILPCFERGSNVDIGGFIRCEIADDIDLWFIDERVGIRTVLTRTVLRIAEVGCPLRYVVDSYDAV